MRDEKEFFVFLVSVSEFPIDLLRSLRKIWRTNKIYIFASLGVNMAKSDKRKQSLYFPEKMLGEIQHEAMRQDRSLSWIVQKAWQIARLEIAKYPSVNDLIPNESVGEDERGKFE